MTGMRSEVGLETTLAGAVKVSSAHSLDQSTFTSSFEKVRVSKSMNRGLLTWE